MPSSLLPLNSSTMVDDPLKSIEQPLLETTSSPLDPSSSAVEVSESTLPHVHQRRTTSRASLGSISQFHGPTRKSSQPQGSQCSNGGRLILPITRNVIRTWSLPVVYIPDIAGLAHRSKTQDVLDHKNFGRLLTAEDQEELNQEDDSMLKIGGYWSSVFNLLNATLGAGAVTVPFAVRRSGILPFTLINVVLYLMATRTVTYLCQSIQRSNSRSYETLSFRFGGMTFGILTVVTMIFFCFGTAVGYTKTVGGILMRLKEACFHIRYDYCLVFCSEDTIADLHPPSENAFAESLLVITVSLFCFLPLSLKDNLSDLRLTSVLGFTSICVMTLMIAVNLVNMGVDDSLLHGDGSLRWNVLLYGEEGRLTPMSLVETIGLLMFSYNCHANVPAIYGELEKRNTKRMSHVSRTALLLACAIYMTAGCLGYLTYGTTTKGNILENTPMNGTIASLIANMVSMISVLFAVIFAFPMNVYPIVYSIKSCVKIFSRKRMVPRADKETCLKNKSAVLTDRSSSYSLYLDDQKDQHHKNDILATEAGIKVNSKLHHHSEEEQDGYASLEDSSDLTDRLQDRLYENIGFFSSVGTVVLTLLVALEVQSVQTVFGVVGAVTGSLVALVFPTMYWFKFGEVVRSLSERMIAIGIFLVGGILGIVGTCQGLHLF